MDTGARVLVAICALGGGGGIPWLLHKTNLWRNPASPSSSTTEVSASTPSTEPLVTPQKPEDISSPRSAVESKKLIPATPIKQTESGNCKVTKLQNLSDILYDLQENNSFYTSVSCKGVKKDDSGKIPENWDGLLPDYLFVNKSEFSQGKEFSMTIETIKLEGGNFQTIFKSTALHSSSVTGNWDKETDLSDERKVAELKITNSSHSGKIFLFLS